MTLLIPWLGIFVCVRAVSDLGFRVPPDTRPEGCSTECVDPDGVEFSDVKVSILIPYRNEKLEHIKGSLASILHYTPLQHIVEILFISDGNGPDARFTDEIFAMSPLVNIISFAPPGVGLISAKMRGVRAVSSASSVLVFLEPHIRCNRQWLEPLLARIRRYPNVLAMPALDLISQDDFARYQSGATGQWRFEWNFNLVYVNPGQEQGGKEAFLSPATSGGIFAIRKDWWEAMELYDEGMFGWGGDHVEATLKVWRCGGHIEVVPCSRVGHLFRDEAGRPYSVEIDQVVKNYARVAEVWLDEWIDHFYKVKPEARQMVVGDLTEARRVRETLQCKNMTWYLEHVATEMLWESDKICIPGCSRAVEGNQCCEGPAASGRSAIDRLMPVHDYRPLVLSDVVARVYHQEL